MRFCRELGIATAGLAAGCVTGLFGAGGGMVLVPLLTLLTDLKEEEIFPSSIAIILPVCITSLVLLACRESLHLRQALPYLAGSFLGGITAGVWGKNIPTVWLHRGLGILVLWGGFRYLC